MINEIELLNESTKEITELIELLLEKTNLKKNDPLYLEYRKTYGRLYRKAYGDDESYSNYGFKRWKAEAKEVMADYKEEALSKFKIWLDNSEKMNNLDWLEKMKEDDM